MKGGCHRTRHRRIELKAQVQRRAGTSSKLHQGAQGHSIVCSVFELGDRGFRHTRAAGQLALRQIELMPQLQQQRCDLSQPRTVAGPLRQIAIRLEQAF